MSNQTDLIERLRHLSSRRVTAEFRNALKEAADALATARNEALEEAARECRNWEFAMSCAAAIRQLKEKK